MSAFFHGAAASLCFVAALFFVRFWLMASDRLFVLFASAFVMLGVQLAAIGLLDEVPSARHYFYVPRLVAFLLIMAAIIDKNRRESR